MKRELTARDAIRAVLLAAPAPIRDDVLVPRVEAKMKRIFGRARLRRLISVLQCTTDPDIKTDGVGRKRTYWIPKRRS